MNTFLLTLGILAKYKYFYQTLFYDIIIIKQQEK